MLESDVQGWWTKTQASNLRKELIMKKIPLRTLSSQMRLKTL